MELSLEIESIKWDPARTHYSITVLAFLRD